MCFACWSSSSARRIGFCASILRRRTTYGSGLNFNRPRRGPYPPLRKDSSAGVPGPFTCYLTYASASLAEATRWLGDGAERGYYQRSVCTEAFTLSRRASPGIDALKRSLQPYIAAERQARRTGKTPTYAPRNRVRPGAVTGHRSPAPRQIGTDKRKPRTDERNPRPDEGNPRPDEGKVRPSEPECRTDRDSAEPTAIAPNRPR